MKFSCMDFLFKIFEFKIYKKAKSTINFFLSPDRKLNFVKVFVVIERIFCKEICCDVLSIFTFISTS